jgi:tRNA pseudouridine55 synthase
MSAALQGLLVVDKPGGITSRAALDQCKRWFPRNTALGHTGTLDPLATGVLVLCVGPATRLAEYVQRMAKTYQAALRLGARSDTDDADGTITPAAVVEPPGREAVAEALRAFVGEIEQVPPAYSAAKVTGRRAYQLARRGRTPALAARRVRIDSVQLLEYAYPRLGLEVHCGRGTYIRSLARDLGERLGCGAYITSLRRTRVGPFGVVDAISPDAAAEIAHARLLPPAAAVSELPAIVLKVEEVAGLRQGRPASLGDGHLASLPAGAEEVAVFNEGRALVAVARANRNENLLRPEKVLPEA